MIKIKLQTLLESPVLNSTEETVKKTLESLFTKYRVKVLQNGGFTDYVVFDMNAYSLMYGSHLTGKSMHCMFDASNSPLTIHYIVVKGILNFFNVEAYVPLNEAIQEENLPVSELLTEFLVQESFMQYVEGDIISYEEGMLLSKLGRNVQARLNVILTDLSDFEAVAMVSPEPVAPQEQVMHVSNMQVVKDKEPEDNEDPIVNFLKTVGFDFKPEGVFYTGSSKAVA